MTASKPAPKRRRKPSTRPAPEPRFSVSVLALYPSSESHVWRILDVKGREVLRDVAASAKAARSAAASALERFDA